MGDVLVLGSGFAGLWAALAAARRIDELRAAGVDVTVVSSQPYHDIRVRNYEPDLTDCRIPLSDVLDPAGVAHVAADVTAIDPAAHTVTTSVGERRYDRLVVALGSAVAIPDIPGLREFGFDVDTYDGAMTLQAHLAGLSAQSTVVVVGAGLTGIETACELGRRFRVVLVALGGPLATEAPTLRAAWSAKGNTRQHSVVTLVDRYGIPASGVRDLLVDYFEEIRPGMDYGSLEGLAYRLVRLFWWEILQINPQQTDLRLAPEVITAWRERLALTTDGRERREVHSILFAVRGLYRDLAEWSHDDPVRWGVWVAPCPVPRSLSRAAAKNKRRQRSQMQSRTRVLTPLLPTFMAAVNDQRERSSLFLEKARATAHDARFEVDGFVFVRDAPPERLAIDERAKVWARLAPGQPRPSWIRGEAQRLDVTAVEDDGFWCWAVVETLRHTGIRIEELMELTQLSLRHYTASTTSTLVPLLHVVPSKTDCERLVPMTPELVQVLLAVLRRAKGGHEHVPLSVRYDVNEKVHGQPFPHLFARKVGTRQEVVSGHYLRGILNHLAVVAGLSDAGQPIRFTPHDFRRLFATDAVNGGLPLHIAAALLGHLNLDTTRGYTAVFPEHLIAAHQAFIERRRQLRPIGEDRVAEDDEWSEFENHFLLRRVALGECHRPYGTPCVHEHACTRCRFLRVDPAQLGRIDEMTENAEQRLVEAKDRAWLGEVAALEESLKHLRIRQAEARQRLSHGSNPFAEQRPQ